MKKLLSLVLALIMLASTAVCLPVGVTAAEPGITETIYEENFSVLPDGVYTLEELEQSIGWKVLRAGTDATVEVKDGVLILKAGAQKDLVFKLVSNDMRLTGSCTVQFDMEQTSYTEGKEKTMFSGVYIGTTTVEGQNLHTRGIIPKCNNEGFHHIALADGVIDEGKYDCDGFVLNGGGDSQARPESVRWGDGYGPSSAASSDDKLKSWYKKQEANKTSMTTWKNVYDVENNQIDAYASGARVNSTAGYAAYDDVSISAYMGKDACLRVQVDRTTKFDNISIVTGGEALMPNGNVVYEQNFDNISFDPETQTTSDLASMIGWKSPNLIQGQDFTEKEPVPEDAPEGTEGTPIKATTTYQIVDGMLDILNPYVPGVESSGTTKADAVAENLSVAQIYLPEVDRAENTVVIEYDQMYVYVGGEKAEVQPDKGDTVYKQVMGEFDGGDQELTFRLYGKNGNYWAGWNHSQKGFNRMGFKNNSKNFNQSLGTQLRPQNVAYASLRSSYLYSDKSGDKHYNLYNSLDHVKVIINRENGVEVYINGALTWFLNASQFAGFDGGFDDIVGSVLRIEVAPGCHVRLDNMKVTVDPETRPDMIITEAATDAFGKEAFEYVEVYNNSDQALNVYDYSLVTKSLSDSYRQQAQKTQLADVLTIYPGKHTYESAAVDKGTKKSLYSVTLENPAYDEGWLQPGQVAVIWNTVDAMHGGTWEKPTANKTAWSYTVEDFRKATFVPENVKVFQSYNSYNTSFAAEGRYIIALAEQSVFQPQYIPAFEWGTRGVSAEVMNSYENYVSYVMMLVTGNFDPSSSDSVTLSDSMTKNEYGINAYPSISNHSYRDFLSGSVNMETGAPATYLGVQFSYGRNNNSKEGMISVDPNLETRYDVSPGVVYDRQKRTVQYTLDGVTTTKYLGTKVYYDVISPTDGMQALFSFVNGVVTYGQPMTMTLVEDTTIERVGSGIHTVKGAALNSTAQDQAIVWTTAIKKSDFYNLQNKYYDPDGQKMIKNIEIGTLVAKTADLTDGVALTVENVKSDGKVQKVGVKTTDWMNGVNIYGSGSEQYYLLTGSYTVDAQNYDTEYSGVGYLSVTLVNGEMLTIYGDYSQAAHSRSVNGLIIARQQAIIQTAQNTPIETLADVVFTLPHQSVYLNRPAKLTWKTLIEKSHFDSLKKYLDNGSYASVEVGILWADTSDLVGDVTLTLENVAGGKVHQTEVKTFAEAQDFSTRTGEDGKTYYEMKYDYEVASSADYGVKRSVVGYVTITLDDGQVITVYSDYNEATHAHSIHSVAQAIRDAGYAGYENSQDKIDALLPQA